MENNKIKCYLHYKSNGNFIKDFEMPSELSDEITLELPKGWTVDGKNVYGSTLLAYNGVIMDTFNSLIRVNGDRIFLNNEGQFFTCKRK